MTDRHDERYVDGDDPEAVYRAWAFGIVDMGGWTEKGSLGEFREAVQDEHRYGTGEPVPDGKLEIVDCTPEGGGR